MTRKRFVKLCMAMQFDRNYANEMAKQAQTLNASYDCACGAARSIRCKLVLNNLDLRLIVVHGTLGNSRAVFAEFI